MAQNNMRKMFTEQQIIDLMRNQNKNFMLVGNFTNSDDTIFEIFPLIINISDERRYYINAISSELTFDEYVVDFSDKHVYQSDGETSIQLDGANIYLINIATGEIIEKIDI